MDAVITIVLKLSADVIFVRALWNNPLLGDFCV